MVATMMCLLAVAGHGGAAQLQRVVTTIDLPSLSAHAAARSPRVAAARARGQAETMSRRLEQPSPWPNLRAGAKVWPVPTDPALTDPRYRVYVQLRLPLLMASSAFLNHSIYEASDRAGAAATQLAKQLVQRDLLIAYAVAHAAQESLVVYAETRALEERQIDVLKARLREGAATQVEMAQAEETLQATLAAADEAQRAGEEGRERIAALTGVEVEGAYLQPMPESLAARDGLDAETRARVQRAEVKLPAEESARYKAQARVAWRSALELDLGLGYAHGTTGTLDELSGVNAFVELYGALDAPFRAARDKQRNLAYARASESEAQAFGEQVAAEAHAAFARWARARGQARVLEAKVRSLKAEWDRLKSRSGLVPRDGGVATASQVFAAEAATRQAQGQLMEARAQEELAYATLLAAEGTDVSVPGNVAAAPQLASAGRALPAARTVAAHGLWVWHTRELLSADPDASALRAFVRQQGIGEVYLSWPRGFSDDPRLVRFVRAFAQAGVRVEALAGEAVWYRADRRAPLLERIDEVARWNTQHPDAPVAGVHLDIEPHQLAENKGTDNRGYLPELVETLAEARVAAEHARLQLAADIPRKLLRVTPAEAAALVAACPRLTLMLYEMPGDAVSATVTAARTALAWGAEVTVGVRAADFRRATNDVIRRIDAQLQGTRGYQGWAIHDYAALRAVN